VARRMERVNELVRAEISELLRLQIKDPRLGGLVSITEVITSPDLQHARVFVSVMGSAEKGEETLRCLGAASRFLRREMGKRLALRRIPELSFHKDDSIAQGAHILQLMKEVSAYDPSQGS